MLVTIRLLDNSVVAQLSSSAFMKLLIHLLRKIQECCFFPVEWNYSLWFKRIFLCLYCGAGRRSMLAYWCSNVFNSINEFQSSRMKLQGWDKISEKHGDCDLLHLQASLLLFSSVYLSSQVRHLHPKRKSTAGSWEDWFCGLADQSGSGTLL